MKRVCILEVMHGIPRPSQISETVLQDRRMEADAVSRAGLPFLRSVVATVRRRISDGIVFNFFVQAFSFTYFGAGFINFWFDVLLAISVF